MYPDSKFELFTESSEQHVRVGHGILRCSLSLGWRASFKEAGYHHLEKCLNSIFSKAMGTCWLHATFGRISYTILCVTKSFPGLRRV